MYLLSIVNIFYNYIQIKLEEMAFAIFEQLKTITQNIKEFDYKNFDYNEFYLSCILWYSGKVQYVKDKSQYLYDNYPMIKNSVDNTTYGLRFLQSKILEYRIEPLRTNWISISLLLAHNSTSILNSKTHYSEIYEYIDIDGLDTEKQDKIFTDTFMNACESAKSIVLSTDKILETMVTMKRGDQYINYVFNKKNSKKSVSVEFPISVNRSKLLSIEYKHPDMENIIIMDLNEKLYFNNNEILSPLFVRRWLEYQSTSFIFDLRYNLKIMDEYVNTFDLKSDKHLLLLKSDYEFI
jgi:hypothetical protein